MEETIKSVIYDELLDSHEYTKQDALEFVKANVDSIIDKMWDAFGNELWHLVEQDG